MKGFYKQLLILLGFVLANLSCADDKNPAQQYGNTMVQSHKSAQTLEKNVTLQQAQKAVQEFHAANGRYPEYLKELSEFSRLALDSDTYDYNPLTGAISFRK